MVRIDDDDPELRGYADVVHQSPDIDVRIITGPRIGAGPSLNDLFSQAPNEPFYGVVADDVVPRTPRWDQTLAAACKGGIAYPADGFMDAKLPTHAFLDGDMVRRLGWINLPSVKHWYNDNVWMLIGKAAGKLQYVPEVLVEHMHHVNGKAKVDLNYAESWNGQYVDQANYEAWLKDGGRGDLERAKG